MRDFLVRSSTLWSLFVLSILTVIAISGIVNILHFTVIDELSDPGQIRAHLAGMTLGQRRAHAWMTVTLDVLFPLAYGLLFIGMALRFFGKWGAVLALPGALVIPADLAEAVVQVLLLNGDEGVIRLKGIITPVKLALFFLGLTIAVSGLVVGLGRGLLRRPA